MLETIFALLRCWSKINLSNFFCQLQQFYEVYGDPFVFEKTNVKWTSLNYGEKDVSVKSPKIDLLIDQAIYTLPDWY